VVRRLVREALVNASRHAPGAAVRVRTTSGPHGLVVDVTNDAGAAGTYGRGTGTGLLGLGELVQELGGRLEHGSRPGAGFGVTAYLPRPSLPVAR
jgi:signal transduction histidine kinase